MTLPLTHFADLIHLNTDRTAGTGVGFIRLPRTEAGL